MNYYPFHIGDYAVHTRHLSLMEDLAYRRLLDLYYTRESVLPADVAQVARLVGMREFAGEVESILNEFFVMFDAGWMHVRCDIEIEKMQERQEKAQAAGQASVAARKAKSELKLNARSTPVEVELNGCSTTVQLPTPTPTPTPEEQKTTAAVASAVPAKPSRATRKCPGDFEVTSEMQDFAEQFPAVNWRAETEKLRDHTFKNAISDWSGAWRNWIRRSAEDAPNARGSPALSFRERDELNAIARVHEMTGGLVSAKPTAPRRPDALQEVFDAQTAAKRNDRLAVRAASSPVRLLVVEQVGGD